MARSPARSASQTPWASAPVAPATRIDSAATVFLIAFSMRLSRVPPPGGKRIGKAPIAFGVEDRVERRAPEIGFDNARIGVQRLDDAVRGIALRRSRVRDFADDDHIGEFDFIEEKIDRRARIAV